MAAQDELALAGAPAAAGEAKAMDMNARDTGSDALVAGMAATVAAAAVAAAPVSDSKKVNPRRFTIVTDDSRDVNLTDFGKDTLDDRYLLPGEKYQDLFARVADAYADDQEHAQRDRKSVV